MTDFYGRLTQESGFDEALVCRAVEFSKIIDTEAFSRSFFDSIPFKVEKSGVLCFDEAFYPFEFYSLLRSPGLSCEKAALYVYICLCERSFKDHKARGLDESIFFDTLKVVANAYDIYRKDTKKDGLYDYHFLANHVRGSILKLGEFEYQYGFFNDKKAIILHVPDNADFEKQKRLESYGLARKYFGNYPIIGDSWLFYNEHKKMLSDDSRILDFMNDFDIISTFETYDYS